VCEPGVAIAANPQHPGQSEPTTAMALGHLEPPLAHFRTHLDRNPSAATSAPASDPSPGQPQRPPDPTPPIADAAGIAIVSSTSGHQKSIAGELRLVLDADLSDHPYRAVLNYGGVPASAQHEPNLPKVCESPDGPRRFRTSPTGSAVAHHCLGCGTVRACRRGGSTDASLVRRARPRVQRAARFLRRRARPATTPAA